MNSAGRVELARIPPTVPATRKTYFGSIGPEPVVDGRLIPEIELLAGRGQQMVSRAFLAQAAHDGGADQAAVAGDVDSRGLGEHPLKHRRR